MSIDTRSLRKSARIGWLAIALTALGTLSALAQTYSDMTYFTVPGCVAVDTRVVGGAFIVNETRTYTVTGSGSFAGQGGSATGCGVPAMSNNVAQVQAINLNVIAIATTAAGFLEMFAADQTSSISLLNFPAAAVQSTNVVVPVNQTSSVSGDIKVKYAGAGGHLLISVTGYYATPQQTVAVHPVPGNGTAAGTNLLNAFSNLAALTGSIAPSSTRHYVVKLDPGIYDLGTSPLNLLSFVDLAGSGQAATIIKGTGYGTAHSNGAVVATSISNVEVRDLQVQANSASGDFAIALGLVSSPITVRRATLVATSNASSFSYGLHADSSSATLDDLTVQASLGINSFGLAFEGPTASTPLVRRANIDVSSGGMGIFRANGANLTIRDSDIVSDLVGLEDLGILDSAPELTEVINTSIQAAGGATPEAIEITSGSNLLTMSLDGVKAVGSGANSIGLSSNGAGTILVNHSELTGASAAALASANGLFSAGASKLAGGVSGFVSQVCSASYNGSYVALSAGCL